MKDPEEEFRGGEETLHDLTQYLRQGLQYSEKPNLQFPGCR
jgi:hypothetical protein